MEICGIDGGVFPRIYTPPPMIKPGGRKEMKRTFLILCLITICNTSYADIASVGYVDSVVAGKQDTITDIETIRTGAAAGATAVQPSTLSTVATSGAYNDLSGKPTLATVATSGSYNDLSNKPTIPSLPTGPSGGRYNLVWNGNTGSFVFELVPHSQCPNGQYYLGFSQCIDPGPNGTDYGYMNDSTGEYGAWTNNTATYGLTTDQTWGVTLYTGDKVTGIASCNSTSGTYAQSTNQNFNQTDTGQYCWCKMTFPAVSRWVFRYADDIAASCAYHCAPRCGDYVRYNSGFRSGVFSSVGQ